MHSKRILPVSVTLSILFSIAPTSHAATIVSTWANANYAHRSRQDIDGHAGSGGSLDNIPSAVVTLPTFVALTCGTDIDCTTIRSDCNDIVFYNADQTTVLPSQQEGACSTTVGGVNSFWIQKTIAGGTCAGGTRNGLACQINADCSVGGGVCSTGDATTAHEHFWVYYGYPSAGNSRTTAVWDTNYKAVYHLSDNCATAACITDATANVRNSTSVTLGGAGSNQGATGKIGLGIQFDGVNDQIALAANGTSGNTARTLCAWYYPLSAASTHYFMGSGPSAAPYDAFVLAFNLTAASNVYVYTNGSDIYSAANTAPANQWHHICATYSGGSVAYSNTSGTIYIDGTAVATTNVNNVGVVNSADSDYQLGGSGTANGILDEVSWSNVNRGAAYIKALYNSQRHDCGGSDPVTNSCFLTANTAEAFATPGPTATHTPTPPPALTPTARPTATGSFPANFCAYVGS